MGAYVADKHGSGLYWVDGKKERTGDRKLYPDSTFLPSVACITLRFLPRRGLCVPSPLNHMYVALPV